MGGLKTARINCPSKVKQFEEMFNQIKAADKDEIVAQEGTYIAVADGELQDGQNRHQSERRAESFEAAAESFFEWTVRDGAYSNLGIPVPEKFLMEAFITAHLNTDISPNEIMEKLTQLEKGQKHMLFGERNSKEALDAKDNIKWARQQNYGDPEFQENFEAKTGKAQEAIKTTPEAEKPKEEKEAKSRNILSRLFRH
jgi:hypothetical protein